MANEATTPAQENEGAITPEGKGAITSEKPEGAATPPVDSEVKIAELQGQVETLAKELAQQKTLQSQADRKARLEVIEKRKLEVELAKIRSGEVEPPTGEVPGETSLERDIRLKAQIGIQNLILDNFDYQEVLRQDLTLKEVLKNNPFALIKEYIDEQDAIDQIKDMLDARVSTLKVQPKVEEKKGEGNVFQPGPVQPQAEPPKSASEQKAPVVGVDAVEDSIRGKINFT